MLLAHISALVRALRITSVSGTRAARLHRATHCSRSSSHLRHVKFMVVGADRPDDLNAAPRMSPRESECGVVWWPGGGAAVVCFGT
jgi:hypothetical protein